MYGTGDRCASYLYGAEDRCASDLYWGGKGGGRLERHLVLAHVLLDVSEVLQARDRLRLELL